MGVGDGGWIKGFKLNNFFDLSSSSYPVYSTYRKLWTWSGKGRTAATHTHKRERGKRNFRLEKDYLKCYSSKRSSFDKTTSDKLPIFSKYV